MLISRLVLNLRSYDEAPTLASLPTLRFAQVESRILGSIGAPIDCNQWDSSGRLDDLDETIE